MAAAVKPIVELSITIQ